MAYTVAGWAEWRDARLPSAKPSATNQPHFPLIAWKALPSDAFEFGISVMACPLHVRPVFRSWMGASVQAALRPIFRGNDDIVDLHDAERCAANLYARAASFPD
ncbi:hypothetical protein ACVIW2_007475 [Bradyrhizobium huanghuaihaiense]|uniref:hypothetical protein n=1 Tax=Bradyrhizobium huanghuaihaiense TaxID=990078 RepID=UPI00036D7CFA|nr:hypothetical protein [Bradyrhizobium huanghuaihaiense]